MICEMWSVTSHGGCHSLISLAVLSLCLCLPSLSERYLEEERHQVTRVSYEPDYARPRRVVVRRIIRPRHRSTAGGNIL